MLLLDTDILIDIERGHTPAVDWFSKLGEIPSIPGLVVMELIQGASNAKELRRTVKLVDPLTVVWPTESDCQRALADFKMYHMSQGLGLLDSLIAACAVGLSADLCTFNTKHYRVVSGLSLKEPYTR